MEIIQTKGLKRNTIDKYYTKDEIVNQCLQFVKDNIQINKNHLIVEPSAGNGSFIKGIKTLSNEFRFYDLEPEHEEIMKQDYLDYHYKEENNRYKSIHVVGNPPFGRQSSLAIKFIKKSCEFCNSFSFILPKSFKKESLKNKVPLNFHLIFEYDLPKNSFLVDNNEHDVPCVFQIWEKKDIERTKVEKLIPNKFTFVGKPDNPDISFRRVGVNAGTIDKNVIDKSEQSHYFIKFDTPPSNELIENIKKIQYPGKEYTVGPKSISKQELIQQFTHLSI